MVLSAGSGNAELRGRIMVTKSGARSRQAGSTEGWKGLPPELLKLTLAMLAGGARGGPPAGADEHGRISVTETRAAHGAVRAVCRQWRDGHDAGLEWLKMSSWHTKDERVRALTGRFPMLKSVDVEGCSLVTDKELRTLSSLTSLTSRSLSN